LKFPNLTAKFTLDRTDKENMENPNESKPSESAGLPKTIAPAKSVAWERDVLEGLLHATLKEQRAKRRWGIFFKLTGLALAGLFLATTLGWFDLSKSSDNGEKHTALIELAGAIDINGEASADSINSALRAAFEDSNTAGVVMRINSPGGSPVQSGLIFQEIKRLRGKYPNIPLYAVVEEMCASGGYFVAAAADKIYVNEASLIGSIGVLMDGFGFTGVMEKVGVERRLLTAGANKGFLDSFSPLGDEQRKFAQQMLADIHQQFIDAVKKGRGSRLKDNPELFSGLVWTGKRSIELGIADEIGSLDSIARDVIKVEAMKDFTSRENIAEKLARRVGASFGKSVGASITKVINGSDGQVRSIQLK
jgi:protease IV